MVKHLHEPGDGAGEPSLGYLVLVELDIVKEVDLLAQELPVVFFRDPPCRRDGLVHDGIQGVVEVGVRPPLQERGGGAEPIEGNEALGDVVGEVVVVLDVVLLQHHAEERVKFVGCHEVGIHER